MFVFNDILLSKRYKFMLQSLVFMTDDSEKAYIREAMETFHQKTCIRFVPYYGESDYLRIKSEMG